MDLLSQSQERETNNNEKTNILATQKDTDSLRNNGTISSTHTPLSSSPLPSFSPSSMIDTSSTSSAVARFNSINLKTQTPMNVNIPYNILNPMNIMNMNAVHENNLSLSKAKTNLLPQVQQGQQQSISISNDKMYTQNPTAKGFQHQPQSQQHLNLNIEPYCDALCNPLSKIVDSLFSFELKKIRNFEI